MNLINPDHVIVPDNRQRRDFDETALKELANSIEQKGLMHPIVLRNDGKTLIAGERRLRAVKLLTEEQRPFPCNDSLIAGMIPYTSLASLNELEVEEAELEENIIRTDLTWQEQSHATARLHQLRQEQKGKSEETGKENWTLGDTITEILGKEASGRNYQTLNQDLMLHEHLDDEEIAKAKTKKEALKILEKKKVKEHREKLAEAFDLTKTHHEIIQGDFFEEVVKLPDATYSVIITDPPYGIDADDFGSQADNAHEYNDSEEYGLECYRVLAREGFRITTDEAHCYAFCDIRLFFKIAEMFSSFGWEVFPTPLIWAKGNGMLPLPEHGPRRTYEIILFANKGKRKVNSVQPDVISIPKIPAPDFGAQKPDELYRNLLLRSYLPGDKVLDCFAGAGAMVRAAKNLPVKVTAIELSQEKINYIFANME